MPLLLWLFLLGTSLYHVLVTVVVYGMWRSHAEVLVIIRDGLWLLFFLVSCVIHRKLIVAYLQRTWYLRLVFIALWTLGVVVSCFHQKLPGDIIIGAKYGMQFFVIFLMAIFFWYVFSQQKEKYYPWLKKIFLMIVVVLIVWFVWQAAKMLMPEFFYSIGYAPLGDWVFGQNPPLYYLTWPGWYARLSWIFSGPNNYGYLMVALFGFWWRYLRTRVQHKTTKTLLRLLFGLSVVGTLSRGAIIWIFLQIIALSFVLLHAKRKYIWSLIVVAILAVGVLSIVKRWSTLEHVRTKFGSLSYVRSNPWGYGLGSSGPSIHTWHGNILPENFFVQILIDIGIPGLLLWLFFWYLVLHSMRSNRAKVKDERAKLHKEELLTSNQQTNLWDNTLLICLSFSFLWLLLEGMFLHVFEDSMVNYWFFILWGIVYGYVQRSENWKSREQN